MSTEAFCIFKRSRVTFRLKRTCHPDRKLPHKRCGCVDGRFSNTTLLSLCLSHASQSHPPTRLFSPSLTPSSLAHFLTFSHNWNSTQCDLFLLKIIPLSGRVLFNMLADKLVCEWWLMCVVSAVWGTETNLQSAVTQEDRSLYWALVILQEWAICKYTVVLKQ